PAKQSRTTTPPPRSLATGSRSDPPRRMPKLTRQQRGRTAESFVDRRARQRGWRPVARNFNSRGGELDLVYAVDDRLIVVEVRYRARNDYGRAAATVQRGKQRRIINATRYFLSQNPRYANHAIRFDVVGV